MNHLLNIRPDRAVEVAAAVYQHYFTLRDRENAIMTKFREARSLLDIPTSDIADADELHGTLPLFRDLTLCIEEVKDDPEEVAAAINGYLQGTWNRHVRVYKDDKAERRQDYATRVLFRIVADAHRPKMPATLRPQAA